MKERKTFYMSLTVAAGVLILWAVYRRFFDFSILIDELVFKPFVWLVPCFWIVFRVEKRKWKSLGITSKNLKKDVLLGLVVGLFFAGERIVTQKMKYGVLTINPTNQSVLVILFTAALTGFSEELFDRGYLLNRWLNHYKNPLIPVILNFSFFALTHVANAIFRLKYFGYNFFTYLLAISVAGVVDIFLFYKTKRITASVVNHTIWNFFAGFIV